MRQYVSPSSYQEILGKIGRDLGWYAVYSSMMRAFKILNADPDQAETLLGSEIFLAAVKTGLERELSLHVYHRQRVKISRSVLLEAMDYYDKTMPDEPMPRISCYLNYLDCWVDSCPDWQQQHPASYSNLEIAAA